MWDSNPLVLLGRQTCWPLTSMTLVGATGIEPAMFGLKGRCTTVVLRSLVAVPGIEPGSQAYETSDFPFVLTAW